MAIDRTQLEHALGEVQPLVSGDGGVLSIAQVDDGAGCVSLRLELGGAACTQCVVEPVMLREIISEYFRDHVEGVRAIALDDPRLGETA